MIINYHPHGMASPSRDVLNPSDDIPSQLTSGDLKPRDRSLPIGDHTTTISLSASKDGRNPSMTTTLMVDTKTHMASSSIVQPTQDPIPTAEASTSNPFSDSSRNVTAATIGGFVGAFVLVLVTAGGIFFWFRRRAKRKRESYSRISPLPWDRSPLFMVPPSHIQHHESYRGTSAAYSFADPLMETSTSVPRLLPPPRPPPPASRRQSSGLILPPRPELEATSIDEKDRRHFNLQLKDSYPTPLSESEVFRPDSVAQLNYQHYQQHARLALSPAPKPKIVRTNIDGMFPDSPTLAPSPVQARHTPKSVTRTYPESPTSIYSVQDSSQLEHEEDGESTGSKEHGVPSPYIARQVHLHSPTSAHTAALPKEFHKSTRYLYPSIPSAPRAPPLPKKVHMSTAYLYAAENSRTPVQPSRPPEEKRNRLRKPAPSSPVALQISKPQRAQTPTILSRGVRGSTQTNTLAIPTQHMRKAASMMDLRQRAGAETVTGLPRSATSQMASYGVPPGVTESRHPSHSNQRPSTVAFDSTVTAFHSQHETRTAPQAPPRPGPLRPRRVTFEPTMSPDFMVGHAQSPRAPQEGTDFGPPDPKHMHVSRRPRTVAFEPTIENFTVVRPQISRPPRHNLDPPRPQSLGPRSKTLIPISDSIEPDEVPKIDVPVAARSPTRFQYPGSPRLTRRSTSTLPNGTSTLVPPRSRALPHGSSSLNPNSHIINNSVNRNVNSNNFTSNNFNDDSGGLSTLAESPTSINVPLTIDSKDIQDIKSTKYLSSEFGVPHGGRRESQRGMTASPTIVSRSTAHSSFVDMPSRLSTITSVPAVEHFGTAQNTATLENPASRRSLADPLPPQETSHPPPKPTLNTNLQKTPEQPTRETRTPKGTTGNTSPKSPSSPNTFGTALVTSTLTYSTSTSSRTSSKTQTGSSHTNSSSSRRGAHHSIQPPHRLMTPLSRGTNISPRMGMGVGLGAGGGWI
ncbi:hypothetical protein QBC37DRAFT_155507 [Rhypophila decipiens]|uniref:Uncharacterized protein n=1 Tax=Rhypophila decipiens TaxID=261697 RepID=A0AAN6Y857_9PEZI|nr:hypothetical protein QBC37DRAFT_155507 [Rhypophila decipiens]